MTKVLVTEDYLEDIADAIRDKNRSQTTYLPSEMATAISNIPSGETPEVQQKDVNFYDYDGKRVYSYTKQEFLALESMPANPNHEGLTPQGWNWTLQEAKSAVQDYDFYPDIGQNYVTNDGSTRIYIHLDSEWLTPTLGFSQSNANDVIVDWGDGSSSETSPVYGTTTPVNMTHTYSSSGDYIITLKGNAYIIGTANGSTLLWNNDTTSDYLRKNYYYRSAIKKIELGNNVDFGLYNLYYLYNLKYITIPKNLELSYFQPNDCSQLSCVILSKTNSGTFNNMAYWRCTNLSRIILPSNVLSSIGSSTFNGNSNLKNFKIFNWYGNIDSSCFSNCNKMSTIKFVTLYSIGSSSFSNCYSLKTIDLSNVLSIPTLANINAFLNIAEDYIIKVPSALYNDWIVATNWIDIASHIVAI